MFGVSGLRAWQLQTAAGQSWSAGARLHYLLWTGFWVVGHLAGGAVVGALLGALGGMLGLPGAPLALIGLSLACLAWALRELGWLRLPMPSWPRQVNRFWMGRLPWNVVALGYGFQLGCGVMTRIKVATTYAVLACALLSGSVLWGAVILATFGLARALLPGLLGPWVASPMASLACSQAIDRQESHVRLLNGLVLLVAGLLLAAGSWPLLRS